MWARVRRRAVAVMLISSISVRSQVTASGQKRTFPSDRIRPIAATNDDVQQRHYPLISLKRY